MVARFSFQFCELATLVIIQKKKNHPNLAIAQREK
jgi:hypothetical protein